MHAPTPPPIPTELLLNAYRSGIFPMADGRTDEQIFWVEPRERAIIPLDGFHCSRSLARTIRRDRFRVTVDADFAGVIEACAAPRAGSSDTWINQPIDASYRALFAAGHAHSVECWEDGTLVGGLYGVAFERVFCGESMFSRRRDASKVALAWLVALMRLAGFRLLDCQFMTDHLHSMGAVTVSREDYLQSLTAAVAHGRADNLRETYCAVLSAASGAGAGSSGVGVGDGVAAGAGAAREDEAPEAAGERGVASSPGKLIAQSLIQTS
ncbi:leucyl/phenylalanyl-tRNA--protein transferase [Croceibacterium ferulae]|uniref:leucyl/phenylalanyl-tRNA--protein transferase n=1 Tax=Croceibacterium ferulae TaxID=1854641 RepID=UPI000EB3E6F6|nr:leucyl/phenylalanyl-tRNA--protein transferase [Croceibacterium ferulae]